MLIDAGADMPTVKRFGKWKSDAAAEVYFAESMRNKRKISSLLTESMELPSNASKKLNTKPTSTPADKELNAQTTPINAVKKLNNIQTVYKKKQSNQANYTAATPNIYDSVDLEELSELFSQPYDEKENNSAQKIMIFNNCTFHLKGNSS